MHNYGHWKKTLALLVMSALSLGASSVDAMPEGGVIRSGEGAVTQNGKEMTIRQDSGRLAMDWTNFNVGKDETVRFQQPGKDALALNRVIGNQQSLIDGSLLSNGHVLLVNPNGVVIGKNASIDVGGLVASTANVKDNFMKEFGNSTSAFTLGGVSDGKIINEGTINAEGGLVALHAAKVENSGTIKSNGGSVLMAAADTLTLTPDTDGKLNFTVDGKVAEASALNKGAITADGGTIVMTADSASDVMSTVVNNEGTLQARTLRKNEKGQILLEGNDKGQVEVSGTLDASGEGVGQDAGNIKVIGQKTIVHDGTNLLAKGDVNGGKIETSGDVLDLGDNLNIDAKGVNGKAGEWLLDPLDVIIADKNNDPTGTDSYSNAEKKTVGDSDFTNGSASIDYNDPEATTANAASVNSAVTWIYTETVENMLNNGTNVTIQATATNGSANIIVKNNIDKTAGGDATFTLDAMRNITVDGNITSKVGKLNVVLNADSDGDKIGAVIINKDIKTNGGDFTSASGGTVKYTSDKNNTKGYGKGTLTGSADPVGHSVGTYFGHVDDSGTADGEKDDRLIQTNGGKITLNGEVAIGLNGGTLTLDSSNASGTKGDITVTGIINSGNSYGAYVYGTTTWDELTAEKVNEYLTSDSVPAYRYQGVNYVKNSDGTYAKNEDGSYKTTTDKADFSKGEPHYIFDKETNTQNIRWLGDGSSTAVSLDKGQGYSSVIITEGKMPTREYLQYVAVSDPTGFLSRYMTSNPTFKVGSTSYTLTVGSVKVNGVDNNALGYNTGGKFTALTKAQIQNLADSALTLAKNSTDKTTMSNGKTAYTNLTNDIKQLIASNWFVSENLAKYNPKTKTYNEGKSAVGDSYLATITTVLENSLTTPNGQQYLWVGGRGSGVLNKKGSTNNDKLYPYSYWGMPDDPTYQDGMYWVTGPEGEANNDKGTQFYSNAGSDWGTVSLSSDGKTYTYNQGSNVYGFVNWDTWPDKATATDGKRVDVTRSQPDNSSPFLSVGYGTHGKWDDGAMGGATTVGFVKETNLANSSLNIKAGSGDVKLQGDIGKAKALDTVNIESKGAVTVGTDNNNVTDYYHGTIYADHGIYISGGTVNVGGEIHSGGTNVEATKMTDSAFSDYLDNVTIRSSGNLTVHGIEVNTSTDSDGNSTSRTDGEGGKIKLISTGKDGVITLGDGVDYNGNNTNGGVLKAASTAQGAVVIDAQGSQGSLVNSTDPKFSAITTGNGGTWQVYVNSPSDYSTSLGSNLISGTNAQWTAKSTANTTVTTNSSSNTLEPYTDISSNKFIFQVTPVITISGGYASKTYGDSLSGEVMAKTLTSKAVYKDSTQKNIDVTSFKNFDESGYLTYVTSSDGTKTGLSTVSVSSDGAKETATRTKGNEKVKGTDGKETNEYKKADDDNRAFYVMDVTYQDGVKTLNGYDKAANDGEVEIKRKTLNISTDGTQTYGKTAVTNGKLSYDKTQLVNGDSVDESTLKYTIATDGTYAASKGSNDTAHAGSYEKQYLTSSAEIKASDDSDASANYEVTGSGTITVKPADLVLQLKDVSTTYGQKFDEKTYGYNQDTDYLKGLLKNGDDASVITDNIKNDAIHYNNTGAVKNKQGIYTADAGANYAISSSDTISLQDYNVTFTSGKSTVNKAILVVDTTGKTRTYGDVTNVAKDINVDNAASFHVAGGTAQTVNGDSYDDILKEMNLSTKSDALVTGDDGKVKTGNANTDPGYDIKAAFKTDLTNYTVTEGVVGKEKIEKAVLVVDTKGNTRTYGDVTNVASDVANAASFHVAGGTAQTVNGDSYDDILKEMNLSTKSDALVTGDDGKVKTGNANTDPGYDIKAAFKNDLTNYTVTEGVVGKEKIEKADLTLTLKDVSTTYGQGFDENTYGYKKDKSDFQGLTNGDDAKAITDVLRDSDFTYVNGGAKSDPNNENVKTQDAGSSYQITGTTSKTLDNYNIKVVNPGASTVNKAKLTLKVGDTSTTYGSGDWTPYTYTLSGNINGDSEDDVRNNQIEVSYSNGGEKSDSSNSDVKTRDVGRYDLTGTFTLKGDTAKNYEIDKENSDLTGTATVNKATVKVKLNDVSTTYGTAFDTSKYGYDASNIQGLTNGDDTDVVTNVLDGTYGTGNIAYTNTGDASEAEKLDGKVTKTVNGGPYYLQGTTSQTLGNYNIEIEDGSAAINKATLHLSTGDYTKAYGDAKAVQKDLNKATTVSGEKNGDSLTELTEKIGIKNTSSALLSAYRTNDVKYKTDGSLDSYDITTSFNKSLDNYTVVLDKTGSIKLTPIAIKVTNEMVQTYGSTDKTFKEVSMPSLVNGDTISKDGLTMKPKAGGAYETNRAGRTTADAGTYYNDLESDGGGIVHENGNDARKNYSVTIEGDIIVKPKDITTRANGTGSTLDNLSWDVHNDSLVNGDVWGKDVLFDKTYGDMISYADKTFGVKSFINGTQISDGTQIGNYIYHPTGIVQLTFNPIVKPDVWAHSGGYRPRNKIETSLPVFRVEDAKVGQYGTYGVEHREDEDKLVLSATGMRLPEPDQVPDEERTFTTTLSTEEGSGTFKLEYNGVSLKVHPQDKKAEEVVRAGDKTKNVSLSEKALYVGYTEMGLDLIDLKGVYIYFN